MPTSKPVITVSNLHKHFNLPHQRRSSLKQAFVNIGRKNYKTNQRVLDGIDFEVREGEFFGIVGRNGSGKSTLLKILAGVYQPSAGSVTIDGELTPFIELGVGFNPELSGRDNIFLNGALLGFSRKEMAAMYDEIVAFAELERFMDQKLKNYSSGMQVRLAFAIAIKAHNDILIFDEVLAVGDEAFQRKCLDVFEQYKANHQTVILVTHDMDTVRQFCTRAMVLDKGKIVAIGNPRKVAATYSQLNQETIDEAVAKTNNGEQPSLISAHIVGEDGKSKLSFNVGERMRVVLNWHDLPGIKNIGVNIFKESGEHVTGVNTRLASLPAAWQDKQEIALTFDLNITRGKYHLLVEGFRNEGEIIASLLDGPRFSVVSAEGLPWSGLVDLPHKWQT